MLKVTSRNFTKESGAAALFDAEFRGSVPLKAFDIGAGSNLADGAGVDTSTLAFLYQIEFLAINQRRIVATSTCGCSRAGPVAV
ncbi:hypothetical protein [Rhizobium leguminosarum]|uniref:hypothetical protein n=1 Tax=Rhizobium leguminosarum TaxID=384 RepID=UPI001C938792|nr:hypothetical protein [Rhizobium leguminosarum]